MWLKPLTNKPAGKCTWDCGKQFVKNGLLIAVPLLLVGCGGQNLPKSAGVTVPKPREKGLVSLDQLAALHPLQADVARLSDMEHRLQSDPVPILTKAKSTYRLPLLPFQPLPLRQDIQREANLRLNLRRRATKQINAVAHDLRVRQQKVIDERRKELEAIYNLQEAETVRLAREAIANRARQRQEEQTIYATNLTIKRQAVEGDIRLLPSLYDRAQVEREIETLRRDPKTYGISDRARLELSLREIAVKRAALDVLYARIRQDAIDAVAVARKQARSKRDEQVAEQLSRVQSNTDIAALIREQRIALQKLESQSLAGIAKTIVSPGGASGAYTMPSSGLNLSSGSVNRDTIVRLEKQRQQLEQFIHADVRDAVRDIAEQHAIDVLFVGATTRSGRNIESRQDMTNRFAVWMRQKATFKSASGLPLDVKGS